MAPVGTTRFQRSQRLRRPAQFKAAYAQGRRFGNELFTASVRANEGSASARLGLSIAARAVGNSVSRNRLRRQIRESFRLRQGETIILPANKPHAVKAATRFKMLLIMIRA